MNRVLLSAILILATLPNAGALTSRSLKSSKLVNATSFSSTQNWTVPADWQNGNNSIECVGGGGGGASGGSGSGGQGGGGGAYAKSLNVTLTPGSTVRFVIGANGIGGAAGAGSGTNGGDSYFCNSTTNCTSSTDTAVRVRAKGGTGGNITDFNHGNANSSLGQIRHHGGNGNWGTTNISGGGGGGGGALGSGGEGQPSNVANTGGGGGGGTGGFHGAFGSGSVGGAGGANNAGTGSGAGGSSANGSAGGFGAGGGGAGTGNFNGGMGGGANALFTQTGGGGGGGTGTGFGGNGVNGGGGGGGGVNGAGGNGGVGTCAVRYGGYTGETGGTISWVNSQELITTSNSNAFNTGSWGLQPTAGNLILCWLEYNAASGVTVQTVTDSQNNLYTRAISRFTNSSILSGNYGEEVWYAKNVSTGASFTVSATLSATQNTDKGISCHEYKGANYVSPIGPTTTAQGSGSSASVGPVTVSTAPAMAIIMGATANGVNANIASGYARRSLMNGSFYADKLITTTGFFSGSVLFSPSGGYQQVMIILQSR